MLRPQVSQKNLIEIREEAQRDERGYLKRLFAQILVEDPLCASVATCLADNARAQLLRDGKMAPDELRQLILDACMFILRVRELADMEGGVASKDVTVMMNDPEIDSLELPCIEAIVHATMFYNKIGVTIKKDR